MQGLGLTTTELMFTPAIVIRYAERDKPIRLIEMMVRFGVDFLTIKPFIPEQIKLLRQASSSH